MEPLVSIMVPAYNREDFLPACLDAALGQTWTDLEVVVVDGASTDETWNICLRYAAADPRVRVIQEGANNGPVSGWQRSLDEARGTYATFLWSDDLIQPTFIERTLAMIRDEHVAFAFTAAEIGSEPGMGRVAYAHEGPLMSSPDFIRLSLVDGASLPVSPACALFRLADLRAAVVAEIPTNPPTDLRSTGAGTDALFFLLTAAQYPSIACTPDPLAFFRAHPGSVTIQGRAGLVSLNYAITKAWFAKGRGYVHLAPRILAKHWLRQMWTGRWIIGPAAAVEMYRGLVTRSELIRASLTVVAGLLRRRALSGLHR